MQKQQNKFQNPVWLIHTDRNRIEQKRLLVERRVADLVCAGLLDVQFAADSFTFVPRAIQENDNHWLISEMTDEEKCGVLPQHNLVFHTIFGDISDENFQWVDSDFFLIWFDAMMHLLILHDDKVEINKDMYAAWANANTLKAMEIAEIIPIHYGFDCCGMFDYLEEFAEQSDSVTLMKVDDCYRTWYTISCETSKKMALVEWRMYLEKLIRQQLVSRITKEIKDFVMTNGNSLLDVNNFSCSSNSVKEDWEGHEVTWVITLRDKTIRYRVNVCGMMCRLMATGQDVVTSVVNDIKRMIQSYRESRQLSKAV